MRVAHATCGLGSISTQPLEVIPYLHNPEGPSAQYLIKDFGAFMGTKKPYTRTTWTLRVRNWNGPVLKATDILGFNASPCHVVQGYRAAMYTVEVGAVRRVLAPF